MSGVPHLIGIAIEAKTAAEQGLMLDPAFYENDRVLARDRGHRFSVARKEEHGSRRIDIEEGIADLHNAMVPARDIKAYETGVFMDGFLHGTSAHPEIFNSTVLKLQIEPRRS